ncbi:MAG: hypothetical protein DRJ02_07575 [Bacteroidetes bacterium]|nr:MAG: hypothetical protein DRJ02_07575 [Bacteroidota bacterium]
MRYGLVLLLWFPLLLQAQVFDDFEDGDFSQNPQWTGTDTTFIVNENKQLQLNASTAGLSWLSTPNTLIGETEWRFFIKMSFSPSSNNNGRFYLVSDQQDVSQSVNGYFLQFGEAGSSDAIELFRQDGGSFVSVCRGTEGLIASSFAMGIKVVREETGDWHVFADPAGGENYVPQGEGFDNTYTSTAFIGVYAKYTVSNSTKFYFDNIYAGDIIVDNDPPVLLSVLAETDSTLMLVFNEALEAESAGNTNNYTVDQGIENPVNAALDEGNPVQVVLHFSGKFENGQNYTISVSGVRDLAGNVMQPQQMDFSWLVASPSDVVINEIMADPSPQVGLPNYEYIELYNQTDVTVSMDNWVLTIGSGDKLFGHVSIAPNGYLIVAKEDAEQDLSAYGPFYGFSSFSLTNSGQILELRNDRGDLISAVTYSDNWYKDPDKEDGGWSLEQINPENICSGGDNWQAAEEPKGGTPGTQNSVYSDLILYPEVAHFELFANNIVHLYYNQAMNPESMAETTAYTVNKDIGNPSAVYTNTDQPDFAELYFTRAFQPGTVYEMMISSSVKNCRDMEMLHDTLIAFGLAETADTGDVVINELLFNPWTNGVDYVEIYNRSLKIIDLSVLQLGTVKYSPPNPPDTSFYPIIHQQTILVPGAYALLTSSPATVEKQYVTSDPNVFLKTDPFPAYNNDEGTAILSTYTGEILDLFTYSEDMHYPLLNYVDGVSLERINFESPTDNRNNWHSAAESVGFGTPGVRNSQFTESSPDTEDQIMVEPEIFSPDNDGYNDVVSIKYTFEQPGYNMTVDVYDAHGRLVRKLVNNEYLGTSGAVNWDGIQDDNTKAPVGIYVFYVQIFDLSGNVKHYKKTCVLAAKL